MVDLEIKFSKLDAVLLPRSLDDVDLAVINGNYIPPAYLVKLCYVMSG